jgi:hypothetical protein
MLPSSAGALGEAAEMYRLTPKRSERGSAALLGSKPDGSGPSSSDPALRIQFPIPDWAPRRDAPRQCNCSPAFGRGRGVATNAGDPSTHQAPKGVFGALRARARRLGKKGAGRWPESVGMPHWLRGKPTFLVRPAAGERGECGNDPCRDESDRLPAACVVLCHALINRRDRCRSGGKVLVRAHNSPAGAHK